MVTQGITVLGKVDTQHKILTNLEWKPNLNQKPQY